MQSLRSGYDVKSIFAFEISFLSHLSQLDKFTLFTGEIFCKSEIAFLAEYLNRR
jgi:hypothetical protein